MKLFYKDFKENNNILIIDGEGALEKGFQIKLNGDVILGMIDRIDEVKGGVEIIDYKTGSPKKTLAKDDKFQLLPMLVLLPVFCRYTNQRLQLYYPDYLMKEVL